MKQIKRQNSKDRARHIVEVFENDATVYVSNVLGVMETEEGISYWNEIVKEVKRIQS